MRVLGPVPQGPFFSSPKWDSLFKSHILKFLCLKVRWLFQNSYFFTINRCWFDLVCLIVMMMINFYKTLTLLLKELGVLEIEEQAPTTIIYPTLICTGFSVQHDRKVQGPPSDLRPVFRNFSTRRSIYL